jgi:hypothetical protein
MKLITLVLLILLATKVQSDVIGHKLDLMIIGDNHAVDITQSGLGKQDANIILENDGGGFDFILHQDSDFDKTYEIMGICANVQGCFLSIYQ